ncbi:hypothetical protein [Georhizobium sp. MAB10]|uniref:hypothetical protein n=1 Tax=Georhizobium sp. MAB10 TaxID=3028319 RepID=UPI003856044B
MNSVVGALRVQLGLDSAQFSNGLKNASSQSDKFAKALKTGIVAAAAAAGAALVGLAASVRSNINMIDDLAKTSSKIGIPIEELSLLRYAADLSGVSMQGLQTGVQRLSRNVADAAKGTGDGAKAFRELGIEVMNTDGTVKSSTRILSEMSDMFAAMPDGAQKTALAMRLMGRSGADMIPLLNGGSHALHELLDEAEAFGLKISSETGKAAEQFNDNLSRIGFAAEGVTLSLTAALAPAMVVISEVMVSAARGFVEMLSYLPQVAEAAAVAGGALSLAFAPSILASIGSVTTAIGVGMVGAVRALTAAMLANPLGAFAVGVAAAITAAYYFRDEIQKAIGVDVVGIVKNAANFVIGSFVAAYEDIKFVWNNFPNVIGAAVVGATNAVIAGVNQIVNGAKMAINDLIGVLNTIPYVDIGTLDTSSGLIPQMENQFAAALTGAGRQRNAAVSAALSRDYIGSIGKAFESSTPAVLEMGDAIADVNDELANLGGGGGGGGGGRGGGSGSAGGGAAQKAADNVKDGFNKMESFVDSFASKASSAFQGLIDGSKKASDVIKDLLGQLSSMLLNQGFKALIGGVFGGGGGGGIFSGIAKAFGGFFANGGNLGAGKWGIAGENGPEIIRGPANVVPMSRVGGAASTQVARIENHYHITGAITGEDVQRMVQTGSQESVRYVKESLPGWQFDIQTYGRPA